MGQKYVKLLTSKDIPDQPCAAYNSSRKNLVHLYENVKLETSQFQSEIQLILNRKESFSNNVATVTKIRDQHITFKQGKPSMEITIVTDYVPWRLHLNQNPITYEQALFLLDGSVRGFRELLHRIKVPFLVQSYMIGVDGSGSVRVWWNERFQNSHFSFALNSDVKLKDMVMSLVKTISDRLVAKDRIILQQNIISTNDLTFVALEDRVKFLAKGLHLKVIGKKIIQQHSQSELLFANYNSMISDQNYHSRVSNPPIKQSEKLIVSTCNQPLKFQPVTKRKYKEGACLDHNEKMLIIKNDIQSLRSAAINSPPIASSSISRAKSVQTVFSYNKGVIGDRNIPEVSRIIQQQDIIQSQNKLTVSRFIVPNTNTLSNKGQPSSQQCTVCSQVKRMKQSSVQGESRLSLGLSRINSLQDLTTNKQIISTQRSINESRLDASRFKSKFGQSQKKRPQHQYFTSLLEIRRQ